MLTSIVLDVVSEFRNDSSVISKFSVFGQCLFQIIEKVSHNYEWRAAPKMCFNKKS